MLPRPYHLTQLPEATYIHVYVHYYVCMCMYIRVSRLVDDAGMHFSSSLPIFLFFFYFEELKRNFLI